uniref:NADH-ubiquinone oxidoreductase chain 1 n=1 Tax=Riccardoella reaumuri TaxID=2803873 RepID=A0A7R7Z5C7_9ACAR|nr:NADH dehydrogenase subunit 1 [Riccardoella reaumuri]
MVFLLVILFLLKVVLNMVLILLSVAFFTLFERKILSIINNRLGPNKVGFWGLLQPFSDALKLFSKEDLKFINVNYYLFMASPLFGLLITLIMWSIISYWGLLTYYKYSFIMFFCFSSLSIYFLLMSGWSSGSSYSFLGSYRSSSQSISYEVPMVFIFLCIIIFSFDYSFSVLSGVNLFIMNFFMMPMLFLCWFVVCLAECNRSPFDFSEGESELVSGFNTEYGGGFFSLIFISEYAMILFFSIMSSLMFFNYSYFLYLWMMFLFFIFLWVRASFPRLRYDLLMMMCWKGIVVYIFGVFMFLFMFMYM